MLIMSETLLCSFRHQRREPRSNLQIAPAEPDGAVGDSWRSVRPHTSILLLTHTKPSYSVISLHTLSPNISDGLKVSSHFLFCSLTWKVTTGSLKILLD